MGSSQPSEEAGANRLIPQVCLGYGLCEEGDKHGAETGRAEQG